MFFEDTGIIKNKNKSKNMVSKLLCGAVKLYQKFISPLLGQGKCRFYPTCSNYALESLQKYGAFKGSFLALKRILRCNPLCKGGYDPVP